MKKAFLTVVVSLTVSLSMTACRWYPRLNPGLQTENPASGAAPSGAPTQSAPSGLAPKGLPLDQSAGQADQALGDLQATLQSMNTDLNPLDAGPVDQSLNDLQGTLQVTPVPTVTVDTSLDQSLDSLQQTLQAQPTP